MPGQQQLTFLSWTRERLADLATGTAHGRARGEAEITLSGTNAAGAPTTSATGTVAFLLAGPADVAGLQPGAIGRRYPAPGTLDHESDRCPYVELRDPGLPWRYTPAGSPGGGDQHPWLVLVVGTEGDEIAPIGDQVTLSPGVQVAHRLGDGGRYPWAHVQVDAEQRRLARLLSGRRLEAGTDYLAVLVPAFADDGTPALTGTDPVTVALYDHWRFRTATPAGSFEDLAGALRPGGADPTTGRADVAYPRVPGAGPLSVRGALAPRRDDEEEEDDEAPPPPAIAADLAGLRTPGRDEAGRPIVGLPRYGGAWHADPDATPWGAALNGDPRHRGVAGVGLDLAVQLQEELVAEARANMGALAEARQRIAQLGAGLAASSALWERRFPSDRRRLLWLLGPALRRLVTDDGAVADLATVVDRPLPPGVFSTAARRILRPGPARTALTAAGTVDGADVLAAANDCARAPVPVDGGVGIDLPYDELDQRRRDLVAGGRIDLHPLLPTIRALGVAAGKNGSPAAVLVADRLVDAVQRGLRAPWTGALGLLAQASTITSDDARFSRLQQELAELLDRWVELGSDPGDLLPLIDGMGDPEPETPPCRPVDLDALAHGIFEAFDPRRPDASARVRVLATIDGLDPAQPLTPPEVCIGLDRPMWKDVAALAPEWLLPGVGTLPPDALVALETNPVFAEAFLVGLNTGLLEELRWRNVPVATACTPLRMFWDRAEAVAGDRLDDIRGIHAWLGGTGLGDPQHRAPGVVPSDLVLVIRSELFRRYPSTVLYLVSAVHGSGPEARVDFEADPVAGAARAFPTFQGQVAADVTFFGFQGFAPDEIVRHWLVFEEPPAGFRFANDRVASPSPPPQPPDVDGADFADQAFVHPVRVLVRGDALDPGA
jgi:hypothetical protein